MWPAPFCKGLIGPLYKRKGDRLRPSSFRPISLLICISKLYEYVLLQRLSPFCEAGGILSEEQCGFRDSRSVLDHILTLDFLISRQRSEPLWIAFLDIEKAYDKTNRLRLFNRLLEVGIRGRVFRSIHSMFTRVLRAVKVGDRVSDFFECICGVPQGSVLSPLLFDIFIDPLIQKLKERNLGVRIGPRIVSCLLFADDVALLATSHRALQQLLNVCTKFAKEFFLSFSQPKSNVVVSPTPPSRPDLRLQDFSLSYCDEYLYLGVEVGLFDRRKKSARWSSLIERIAAEASRRTREVLAVCGGVNGLSPYLSRLYYLTYVSGRLDFAAQIWSLNVTAAQQSSLDKVQAEFVRSALHLPDTTPLVFCLAELNMLPLHLHHREMALRYYGKVCCMPPERLPRILLDEYLACPSRHRQTWFNRLHKLISSSYPSLSFALSGSIAPPAADDPDAVGWPELVRKAVADSWLAEWQNGISSYRSLRYYASLKSKPEIGSYLKDFNQVGVSAKLRLCSGTLATCALLARQRRLPSPTCLLCNQAPETRSHILLFCSPLEPTRQAWLDCMHRKCSGPFSIAFRTLLDDVLPCHPHNPLFGSPSDSSDDLVCFLLCPKPTDRALSALRANTDQDADLQRVLAAFGHLLERGSRILFARLLRHRESLLRAILPADSPLLAPLFHIHDS